MSELAFACVMHSKSLIAYANVKDSKGILQMNGIYEKAVSSEQ